MEWSRFLKDSGKRLLWLAGFALWLVVMFYVWNFVSLLVWHWLVGVGGCDDAWSLMCYTDRQFLDFEVWTNRVYSARFLAVLLVTLACIVLWFLVITPFIKEYRRAHGYDSDGTCRDKACNCVLHPKPYEADTWDEAKGHWVENMAKCHNPDCKCEWNHTGQKFSKKKLYWVDKN